MVKLFLHRQVQKLTLSSSVRRYRSTIEQHFRLFFTGGNRPLANEDDSVLGVIREHPTEALWFIKVVMLFGVINALLVTSVCISFLLVYWQSCGECNRPLRFWNVCHCGLLLLQTPVRLVFFLRLTRIQPALVQEEVKSIATSPAWTLCKRISIANYGWFILGVVWLMNSTHCAACPWMFRLTSSIICFSLARLAVTLVCFYRSFPPTSLEGQVPYPCMPAGANDNEIKHLPSEKISSCSKVHGETCSICLSNFEIAEDVRNLPCAHVFHMNCIDQWLRRHRVCPLCITDVCLTKTG